MLDKAVKYFSIIFVTFYSVKSKSSGIKSNPESQNNIFFKISKISVIIYYYVSMLNSDIITEIWLAGKYNFKGFCTTEIFGKSRVEAIIQPEFNFKEKKNYLVDLIANQ